MTSNIKEDINMKTEENNTLLEIDGKSYDMVYNLNVMEQLQEKFGSLRAFAEMVNDNGEAIVKNVMTAVFVMVNEAISIDNDTNSDKVELYTYKRLCRACSSMKLSDLQTKVAAAMFKAVKSKNGEEKNA